MTHRQVWSSRRRVVALAVGLSALGAGGCTDPDVTPGPVISPAPVFSSGVPPNTIALHEVGDRLTATAAVVAVLGARAFVIGDADLPDRGVLVLGGESGEVHLKGLVTVAGKIDRFGFVKFADAYQLDDPEGFRRFDGRKMIVAETVRSWA